MDNKDITPGAIGISKDSRDDADLYFSLPKDEMHAAWRNLVEEEYSLLVRPQRLTHF